MCASRSKTPAGDFRIRLLVKSEVQPALSKAEISLNDQKWHLVEYNYEQSTSHTGLPSFACISYRWFDGREPNPFYDGKTMSTLTLPSLATAVRNSSVAAFWIDAFCVPPSGPLRNMTLENMGLIYHLAEEVLVVLSGCRLETVLLMSGTGDLSSYPVSTIEDAVNDLNADQWVKSIWTYQESVNSRQHFFMRSKSIGIGENRGDVVISGTTFFNRVGQAMAAYKTAKGINSYDICTILPNLHVLEDLVADWQISDFLERSALQIMSNLDRRVCQHPMDYFYSLIGSITDEMVVRRASLTLAELCEKFIDICEKKNDFSFIYTSTPRNKQRGRMACYPAFGPLHSILPWHSNGESQRGGWNLHGLTLDAMVLLHPTAALGPVGREFIRQWHHRIPLEIPDQSVEDSDIAIADRTFRLLETMRFTGSAAYVLTTSGLFFPQEPVEHVSILLVATQITWVFGAPGLVKAYEGDKVRYITGVFIGQVAASGASSVLLEGTENGQS